jgi:fructose-bisphosphate aldolase, class I
VDIQSLLGDEAESLLNGGIGPISGHKAFQRPTAEGVDLLNAIQDVYLDRSVTIA